jgi:2-dehydro-3-deoxygalactonokinase
MVERGSRRVLAERSSADGVKAFSAVAPEERASQMARFLAGQLAAWAELDPLTPIIVTGMASSNVGWRELPYASTPFPLDGSRAVIERIEWVDQSGHKRTARLVSGVRAPDDVMRGEECALIGAEVLRPVVTGRRPVLGLLAGTHPKHVRLLDHALVSFRTHLTGELFDVLSRESLLSGSMDRAALEGSPDLAEFAAGVACARDRGLSGALFQVRARHISHHTTRAANAWFLSGILVGSELERVPAELQHADVLLIGEPTRVALYRSALRELGAVEAADRAAELSLAAAIMAGQERLLERAGGM